MKGAPLQNRQWRPFFYFLVLVCAVTVWVAGSASAVSFADEGDDTDGSLELNTDVIVNESVGVGATGEFAIRGKLFLEDLTARSQALREASDERLHVDETLTFQPQEDTTAQQYQALRAGLFETYKPNTFVASSEETEDFSLLYSLALVAAALAALVGGVSFGRFWARRKQISS